MCCSRFAGSVPFLLATCLAAFASFSFAQEPLDADRFVEIVLRAHPAAARARASSFWRRRNARRRGVFPDPVFEYTRDRGELRELPGTWATETGYSVSQTIPWPGTFGVPLSVPETARPTPCERSAQGVRWELGRARATGVRTPRGSSGAGGRRARRGGRRPLAARPRDAPGGPRGVARVRPHQGHGGVAAPAKQPAPRPSGRPRASRGRRSHAGRRAAASSTPDPRGGSHPAAAAGPRVLARRRSPAAALAFAPPWRKPSVSRRSLPWRAAAGSPTSPSRCSGTRSWTSRRLASAFGVTGAALERQPGRDRTGGGRKAGSPAPSRSACASSLTTELQARLKELQIAGAQAALLDRELLPAAERSVGLVRLSFEEGETSLLDLLDAQRTLREIAARSRRDPPFALARARRGPEARRTRLRSLEMSMKPSFIRSACHGRARGLPHRPPCRQVDRTRGRDEGARGRARAARRDAGARDPDGGRDLRGGHRHLEGEAGRPRAPLVLTGSVGHDENRLLQVASNVRGRVAAIPVDLGAWVRQGRSDPGRSRAWSSAAPGRSS